MDSALRNRSVFLISGVVTVAAVVVTPIGFRSDELFWCHMVQHITLMMISGPLLVLGTAATFHPKNPLFRALTHPVLSWILYASLMIGVHLPTAHEYMMNRPWIHWYFEVPAYIIISYFFYFNLLDRNQAGRRVSPAFSVISLFLMMVPETLTGFFIYAAPSSLYMNMFTLDDQRRGGSIMWSGGMIIDAIWIALAVQHWFASEERKSRELDAVSAEEAQGR